MVSWTVKALIAALCATALVSVTITGQESLVSDGINVDGETFEFQAEVSRLMDIIIHSLYQNKDIFLRELISNASDALDKLRFVALTDKTLLDDDAPLDIRVEVDKEEKTLSITDKGIGMTRDDLITNLGTVARSGTAKFLDAISSGKDALGLIGQFGVGFYSAFLVADKVTVTSKNANDTQYIWESDAKSSFKIYLDPAGETLGSQGTRITLHIKEDENSYLEEPKLEEILTHYSEFIEFPIYLKKVKSVMEEVPDDEEDEAEDEQMDESEESDEEMETTDGDELEVEDVQEESKPKQRNVEKVEWELMNENKPIWTRPKSELSEQEYVDFFKAIAKDKKGKDPLSYTHFKAEGGVEFSALLYVPSVAPRDLYEQYQTRTSDVRLYVRRVLLKENIDNILPKYLSFIRGVVDSDDLPISVSRETLQKSKVVDVIGKKLTRRVLKMLQDMADADNAEEEETINEEVAEGDEDNDVTESKYEKFWNEFSQSIKLGVLEDMKNKEKLKKLLRFYSVQSPEKLISLDQYVEKMPEDQKFIYYITGSSQAEVQNSPMLEALKQRGYDVLFFVNAIDMMLAPALDGYDDIEFSSVTKDGLKFGDEDEEDEKELEETYKPMTDWLEETLGKDRVGSVKISKRVTTSPAVLISPKWGWDASTMRTMMASQSPQAAQQASFMTGQRILEINPYHPVVKELQRRVDEEEVDEDLEQAAVLLFDSALISSGYSHTNPEEFSVRLGDIVAKNLGVHGQEVEVPPPRPKKAKTEVEDEFEEEDDMVDKDEL
jgi:heat shock protein beta